MALEGPDPYAQRNSTIQAGTFKLYTPLVSFQKSILLACWWILDVFHNKRVVREEEGGGLSPRRAQIIRLGWIGKDCLGDVDQSLRAHLSQAQVLEQLKQER